MKILNILEITNKDYSGQPIANRYFAQRIEQYATNIDKTRVFYSYQLLKESLKILSLDLDKLVINTTEDGKPFFEDETLNLFFSITHNKNYVATILADYPVGIDIQILTKLNTKVANRFFSAKVCKKIAKSNCPDKLFTEEWTKYESRKKIFGNNSSMRDYNKKIKLKLFHMKDQNKNKYYLCVASIKKHFA